MIRAASSFLLSALCGCAAGHVLRPADPANLTPSEGLLVVEVDDGSCPLVVGLCHDGDLDRCMTVGPIERDQRIVIAQLPAGRACINRLQCATGDLAFTWDIDAADSTCVDVEPSRIAYPGDFAFTPRAVGNTSYSRARLRFLHKTGIAARVSAAYPLLAAFEVNDVEPRSFRAR